jgi:Arc/MetJ-type ribon-helix-helix transcriptional regulator
MTKRMTEQVVVRLPAAGLADLDAAIARGRFANRTAALREALERLLGEERERLIDEAYRRGYAAKPQEEWLGEAGLAAFAAFAEAEGRDRERL